MFTKLPWFLASVGSPYACAYLKYFRSEAYGLSIPNAALNSNLFDGRYFNCAQPPTESKPRTSVLAEAGSPLNNALRPIPPPSPPMAFPRYSFPLSENWWLSGSSMSVIPAQPSTVVRKPSASMLSVCRTPADAITPQAPPDGRNLLGALPR